MEYELKKYLEYFVIDEGYYPEINESSIKDPKNKWQNTFPHRDIVELLKNLERALSRSDKKSLWVEGAYGTGKSRILWMMKNLLTCSESDFDAYFDEYENLRSEIDLRERLRTIRKGKIVTATRYATGDITSTQKLIFAVFESLTAALQNEGYLFDGAKTLRGKIANWLESDTANLEMFRAKIKKPEYMMFSTLARRSAEEIIERLKNPKAEVAQLVEEILKLGEREGIIAFSINMTDLIAWITEIIEENDLKAVILFWDEFSKFFSNNRNNLDEFQHLAELSNIAPFYFVIATHESESLAEEGGQSFRIVHDRFYHRNMTMPDNIAFELIGHALKVKDVAQNEWEQIITNLKDRTAEPRKVVMEIANNRENKFSEKILTDILPIHPVAAILLKNLAAYFGSNQRSIFNFIKNSDPNVKAFQDFIATKSPENGDLLTVDYLWNFFYESGTDEHGGNVGRMNLKPSIRAILDTYSLNEGNLEAEEKIVLKTILLLQAIEQESHGNVSLFHPNEKNLELAFTGVSDFENGRATTIANNLIRKEILYRKPDKISTFAAMALGGDFSEIERLKKQTAENVRTADLIASANLLNPIELDMTPSQKFRYVLYPVTADNVTLTINRLVNEKESYKIKVVICFARNEIEQDKLFELISGAINNSRYYNLVFIDASSNLINREVFKRWVENAANEKHWRGKDNALADKMKQNAADCLDTWQKSIENGSFVYYPALKNVDDERKKISCQGSKKIIEEFQDNVRQIYPYTFDNANVTNTLFLSSQLKKLSEAGINQTESALLKNNTIKIILGDLWQMSEKYWEVYPDRNISRLKIELDELIKNELATNIRISFDEIIEYLLDRGFMPLNIYAFLTGFLLKEYAADPYRFSADIEGNFGGAMSPQKLSECISESLKQISSPTKNYRPKYLEIMSPNQRQFMKFASEIFGVTEDISVEQSAQKLRLRLKNLGYPLWCYVDAVKEPYKNFMNLLAEIANSTQAVSVAALAEDAGQFLTDNPATFHSLKNFFTSKNGLKIFTDFLKKFDNGIIFKLAKQVEVEDVISECQRRVTAGDGIWLRDKDTAIDDLKKLIVDYKIIVESTKFGIKGNSLNACIKSWAEYCKFHFKMPGDIIGNSYPALKNFFLTLREMVMRGEIPQSQRENFLNSLVENGTAINTSIADYLKVFRENYKYQVNGLTDHDLSEIQAELPHTAFVDSQGHFIQVLNDRVQKRKNALLHNELFRVWRDVAGNRLPNEWSNFYRTPILIMVPDSELATAQKVFATVNNPQSPEKDVRFAIDYLKKGQPYLDAIKTADKVEEIFSKIIVGKHNAVLEDNDEVRDELEVNLHADFYHWYPNYRTSKIVEEFARNKYYSGGAFDKLTAKVGNMSDSAAKSLLIELVDKSYEVGLKILRSY